MNRSESPLADYFRLGSRRPRRFRHLPCPTPSSAPTILSFARVLLRSSPVSKRNNQSKSIRTYGQHKRCRRSFQTTKFASTNSRFRVKFIQQPLGGNRRECSFVSTPCRCVLHSILYYDFYTDAQESVNNLFHLIRLFSSFLTLLNTLNYFTFSYNHDDI